MKRASHWGMIAALALFAAAFVDGVKAEERVISHDELMDKLSGFWIGSDPGQLHRLSVSRTSTSRSRSQS